MPDVEGETRSGSILTTDRPCNLAVPNIGAFRRHSGPSRGMVSFNPYHKDSRTEARPCLPFDAGQVRVGLVLHLLPRMRVGSEDPAAGQGEHPVAQILATRSFRHTVLVCRVVGLGLERLQLDAVTAPQGRFPRRLDADGPSASAGAETSASAPETRSEADRIDRNLARDVFITLASRTVDRERPRRSTVGRKSSTTYRDFNGGRIRQSGFPGA
jgi:hypothetical protein